MNVISPIIEKMNLNYLKNLLILEDNEINNSDSEFYSALSEDSNDFS